MHQSQGIHHLHLPMNVPSGTWGYVTMQGGPADLFKPQKLAWVKIEADYWLRLGMVRDQTAPVTCICMEFAQQSACSCRTSTNACVLVFFCAGSQVALRCRNGDACPADCAPTCSWLQQQMCGFWVHLKRLPNSQEELLNYQMRVAFSTSASNMTEGT